LQLQSSFGMLATQFTSQGGANVCRHIDVRSQCSIMKIANKTLLVLIPGASQVDKSARVSGQNQADGTWQTEPQRDIVLGHRIFDLTDAAGHAIKPTNDSLLHLGRQTGNTSTRNASL